MKTKVDAKFSVGSRAQDEWGAWATVEAITEYRTVQLAPFFEVEQRYITVRYDGSPFTSTYEMDLND